MEKINFINNSQPAINDTNLNKLQDNTEDAIQEVQDIVDDLDTNKLDKTSVKDTYSTSTTYTYSCNYVNGINDYSTDEVFTGKYWIDNRPIYRKVITITEFSSTAVNINTGITNISEITSIDGSFNRTGYTRRYPIFNLFMDEWSIDITTGILTIKTNNQYVTFTGYITIEYTKTTD